jgi:hypothetical protein
MLLFFNNQEITMEERPCFYVSIEDPASRTTMEVAISHDVGWQEIMIRYAHMLQGIGYKIDIEKIEKTISSSESRSKTNHG